MVTHRSHPLPWTTARAAWLAAARAPNAGAPVLAPGVLDGASSPRELHAVAARGGAAYLAEERAMAEAHDAPGCSRVIYGASTPSLDDLGALTWGTGRSTTTVRPVEGGYVVEVACEGDPYALRDGLACAALARADAARLAGVTWAWIRADVRPVERARREVAAV
jgi:hypothetical protein